MNTMMSEREVGRAVADLARDGVHRPERRDTGGVAGGADRVGVALQGVLAARGVESRIYEDPIGTVLAARPMACDGSGWALDVRPE